MICTVGLNCLDIVSFVTAFPKEDSDSRCKSQVWARGGNASNNATVLAVLGQPVEFFGTLANDHLLSFFTQDMTQLGIAHGNCPIIEGVAGAPASVVICSEETGSRTIIHNNGGLPELSFEQFKSKINVANYSWIHFEGRNATELPMMLEYIQQYNEKTPKLGSPIKGSFVKYLNVSIPVSIEIEKCRDYPRSLMQLADVVFVGKDYASWKGAKSCIDAAKMMLQEVSRGTVIICPWGEDGAAFGIAGVDGNEDGSTSEERETNVRKIDAFPPTNVIDSLGAGDTFLATTILCLNKGVDVEASVKMGCRIACEKLSIRGFLELREKASIVSSLSPTSTTVEASGSDS